MNAWIGGVAAKRTKTWVEEIAVKRQLAHKQPADMPFR